jgi:hypothetical protein
VSALVFKDIEVVDTRRNPPQVELNVIFEDASGVSRIGTLLRHGRRAPTRSRTRCYTLSQVVKRGPTQ